VYGRRLIKDSQTFEKCKMRHLDATQRSHATIIISKRNKLCRLSSKPTRAPGRLKVKSADGSIQIEDLSSEKQIRHELAFHRATVDFGQFDAAGGYFCFFVTQSSLERKGQLFQLSRDRRKLLGRKLRIATFARDFGLGEQLFNEPFGKLREQLADDSDCGSSAC